MSIAKIQTGDQVKVITGKFKGTVGTVLSVLKKTYIGGKLRKFVTISGVDKIAKFRKKTNYDGQEIPGQLLQKDRKIDITNVMLVDDKNQTSRSKVVVEDGKKQRVYIKTQKVVTKAKSESETSEKKVAKTIDVDAKKTSKTSKTKSEK